MEEEEIVPIKCVFLGETAARKINLINRFENDIFQEEFFYNNDRMLFI